MKEIENIIENFILDFFNIDKVNELINTKSDKIELESNIKNLLMYYLSKIKIKGEK